MYRLFMGTSRSDVLYSCTLIELLPLFNNGGIEYHSLWVLLFYLSWKLELILTFCACKKDIQISICAVFCDEHSCRWEVCKWPHNIVVALWWKVLKIQIPEKFCYRNCPLTVKMSVRLFVFIIFEYKLSQGAKLAVADFCWFIKTWTE